MPSVLTIAGSDSGAGAGIQADLKTFAACGCFGTSALTALTAQNSEGVRAIHAVPTSFVQQQIDAIFEGFTICAVKIGMLYRPSIIRAVSQKMRSYNPSHIVLDPVMTAQSGKSLLSPHAVNEIVRYLFPIATLITPNLPEAAEILGYPVTTVDQMAAAACDLLKLGPQAVLLKGGHLSHDKGSDCLLMTGHEPIWLQKETIVTPSTHGTGCTYSAAIAAFLARGFSLLEAVKHAKEYLHGSLVSAQKRMPGKALDHFWRNPCQL